MLEDALRVWSVLDCHDSFPRAMYLLYRSVLCMSSERGLLLSKCIYVILMVSAD